MELGIYTLNLKVHNMSKDYKVAKIIQSKFWENKNWLDMSKIQPKPGQDIIGYGTFYSNCPGYQFMNDMNIKGICHGRWDVLYEIVEEDPLNQTWYENITHWMPEPPKPNNN
jgi:hypothetical protein